MINRRSVRFYLSISHALFVLVVLSLAVLFWYNQQEQIAEDSLRVELEQRARLLATTSTLTHPDSSRFFLPITTAAINNTMRVVYLHPDGTLKNLTDHELNEEDQQMIQDLGKEALSGVSYSKETHHQFGGDILYAAAPVVDRNGAVNGAICLILPIDEFDAQVNRSRADLFAFVGGISLLNLLLAAFLSTLVIQPLSKAKKMVAEVASGDYSQRLADDGPHELAELAGHLNQMADELEKQQQTRRLVLANVTHELARPLGALRLGVDSLRAGAIEEPEVAEDLLMEMNRTLQRMEALVDDLSLAARPVTKPISIQVKPIPVEPMLQGLRSRFWPRAETNGIDLEVLVPSGLPEVLADEVRLNQILANLLDNAVKFSPVGGKVQLQVQMVRGRMAFLVIDNGPGIPEQEIHHVFEPFYQSAKGARIRQGMGLGLGIVRQLVIAQNGEITIVNRPEGGLCVTVYLPVA